VPVSGTQAVACAFGNHDLGTLFMACNDSTLENFLQGRSSGVIAVAEVGRTGAPGAAGG
jgi:hypothetical protein